MGTVMIYGIKGYKSKHVIYKTFANLGKKIRFLWIIALTGRYDRREVSVRWKMTSEMAEGVVRDERKIRLASSQFVQLLSTVPY